MIPYAVVEYYGPIGGNFDATGAGITSGNWEKIYLCNGQNGTPDKRGKVGVGTTDGSMLGLALPSNTNPASSTFNPTYTLGGTAGSNQVTLTASQLPSHTHLATAVSTATPHTHNTIAKDGSSVEHSTSSAFYNVGNTWSNSGIAVSTDTGIDDTIVSVTTTVTNNQTGGDLAHSNVQVGLGCYYIQYRP
jgi:microcystin-dependent protein